MSRQLVGVAFYVAFVVVTPAAAAPVVALMDRPIRGGRDRRQVGRHRLDHELLWRCLYHGGLQLLLPDASSPRGFNTTALRGSGYAGFNLQLQDWVLGVEGNVGFGNKSEVTRGIPGCTTDCGFFPPTVDDIDTASIKVRGDASIRGRAGFLVVPSVLVYGTAGAAFQRVSATLTCSFAGPWCTTAGPISEILSDSHSANLTGWTAGGGLEWMVHDGWLLRSEYRYSDLGSFSPTFFEGTTNAVFTDIHVVTQEVTFGVGFKF